MASALVAIVDFARVCEVQTGYRGEFFCGGGWAGEDGGAGAGPDVEDLVDGEEWLVFGFLGELVGSIEWAWIGKVVVVTGCLGSRLKKIWGSECSTGRMG